MCFITSLPDLRETMVANRVKDWRIFAYPRDVPSGYYKGHLPRKMTDAECLEHLVPHLHRHEHLEWL